MKKGLIKRWKDTILKDKFKLVLSLVLLIFSIISMGIAGDFVDETNANSVPDLILNHIPTVNLNFLFVYGMLLVVIVFILYPIFYKPEKFPYAINMLSFFIVIRTGFTVLTHLKIPVNAVTVTAPNFLHFLTFSNDLFFSGHAGVPFLGFLIYENKKMKYFMLISSIILSITVLLMHVHYSIDVVSAFFITYGIYKLGDILFGESGRVKDKK